MASSTLTPCSPPPKTPYTAVPGRIVPIPGTDLLLLLPDEEVPVAPAQPRGRPRGRVADPCTCPHCVAGVEGGGHERHLCHVPECGKTFTKTSHLQVHLKTHAGVRPFPCTAPHCGASFSRRNDLLRHIGSLHSAASFPCNHCGKVFGRKDHMKQHEAICSKPLTEFNL